MRYVAVIRYSELHQSDVDHYEWRIINGSRSAIDNNILNEFHARSLIVTRIFLFEWPIGGAYPTLDMAAPFAYPTEEQASSVVPVQAGGILEWNAVVKRVYPNGTGACDSLDDAAAGCVLTLPDGVAKGDHIKITVKSVG